MRQSGNRTLINPPSTAAMATQKYMKKIIPTVISPLKLTPNIDARGLKHNG